MWKIEQAHAALRRKYIIVTEEHPYLSKALRHGRGHGRGRGACAFNAGFRRQTVNQKHRRDLEITKRSV